MTPTPTPRWGAPQLPPEPPPGPERRKTGALAIAVAVAVVALVAIAVGLVVHHSSVPADLASSPAPTPSLIAPTTDPTQAPDFVPPTVLAPDSAAPDTADPQLSLPGVPSSAPSAAGSPSTLPSSSSSAGPSAPPTAHAGDDPEAAVRVYYGTLAADKPASAFTMLCQTTQTELGESGYVANYNDDVSTGTGIKSWTAGPGEQIQGNAAEVPGTLALQDKESVPITVLVLRESGAWHVCSSDLGGVLPNPGSGSGSGSGSGGGVTT